VTDEIKLTRATEKAAQAQRLLDDETLKGAFKTLEEGYLAAWRATTIDDISGREKLFLAVNVIGKVRDHLAKIVDGGKLAQAELKELTQVAERKKRFGIV
jgi:hypothetical protein